MDIIDRINLKLSILGKNGAEMSRDLGLSNSVYSQWNTKKSKPSNKTLALLAPYLNTTVEYLLSGEDQKENLTDKNGEVPGGLGDTKYFRLNDENRALIDSMIEKLLKSQSDD